MPRAFTFAALKEGELFLFEDGNSDLVLYRKQGGAGAPYDRYAGIRHGVLGFLPAREHPAFAPDALVYKLSSHEEGD